MSVFADRLRKLRKEKGLSQEETAHLVEVKRETYSRWEQGTETTRGRVPKIDKLAALCKELGCDSGYLMGEHETAYYETCDISERTGLSESAVLKLNQFNTSDHVDDRQRIDILNYLIEHDDLLEEMRFAVFGVGKIKRSWEYESFLLSTHVHDFVKEMRNDYQG